MEFKDNVDGIEKVLKLILNGIQRNNKLGDCLVFQEKFQCFVRKYHQMVG